MFLGHIGIYASNKDVIRRKSTLFFFEISTNNKDRVFQNYCIQFRIK